jgi:hypothetical protein
MALNHYFATSICKVAYAELDDQVTRRTLKINRRFLLPDGEAHRGVEEFEATRIYGEGESIASANRVSKFVAGDAVDGDFNFVDSNFLCAINLRRRIGSDNTRVGTEMHE